MHLFNFIALAGTIATASSTPVQVSGHSNVLASRRAAHHIYTCSSPGWTGDCWLSELYPGQCMPLGGAKSFGPDPTLACSLFPGYGCSGVPHPLNYPGDAALSGSFESYMCCGNDAGAQDCILPI